MRNTIALVLGLLLASGLSAGELELLEAKPLYRTIAQRSEKVKEAGAVKVPVITWGGDVATIYAQKQGVFKKNGMDVELFAENNFPKQVEACLSGKTPYLRGTMGMINAAAEAFSKQGLELVVIYQLTWSAGGDALVVRPGIGQPRDLKNKTLALQLYGPHMDYLGNVLASASVSPRDVKLKWFRELTLPTYDPGNKVVDPVNGFMGDKSLDAVMCISPDAVALTSGGKEGTGSEGSVKGARILLTTKTANRVIADVYAVRSDYFAANRGKVERFVTSLLQAEEGLGDLLKNKAAQATTYQQLMSASADLLLGAPQAVPDVEGLLGDCDFAGYDGNLGFFTGQGTTRTMKQLTSEIQPNFKLLGLMEGSVALKDGGWDYAKLAQGLKYVSKQAPKEKPKFDAKKVVNKIEAKINVEPSSWADDDTLFQVEINFGPNQSTFTAAEYAEDFAKALSIAQTYGGALIVIEGHSDPLGILKAREKGSPAVEINQMQQIAKNLSLERSQAVRDSFLEYCKSKKLTMDESQFVAVGLGVTTPKFNPPRTKEEWAANRRVVFRIKQVEAELSEFAPLQ